MLKPFFKIRLVACCLALSVLVHFLCMYTFRMFGSYDFGAAVNQPQGVMVDLTEPKAAPAATPVQEKKSAPEPLAAEKPVKVAAKAVAPPEEEEEDEAPAVPEKPQPIAEPVKKPSVVAAPKNAPAAPAGPSARPVRPAPAAPSTKPAPAVLTTSGGQFLAAKYEKLTYQITKLGMPIGSVELEAKYDNGVTTITMRTKSNSVISNFYPVDDLVETSHIDKRYIMNSVKQQEADFRSDEMFTINLGKKRVIWDDILRHRNLQMNVPADDVLDTLSGIYYLRNRQLQVGKTETMHIFDSEVYAEVPVEVLRREELRLPNLTKVNTLVIRPQQKTAGIFRRTGDVLIWMTDDQHKVPVRIETSIALGRVTADLISAESTPPGADGKAAPPGAAGIAKPR